jgi:hypothetical protein
MSLAFDQLMAELAAYLQTDLGFEHDVYSLVVPIAGGRHQEIAATIRKDRDGRELIDFVSTVGQVHGGIDPWALLQANAQSCFSRVTIARQVIYVLASQLLATEPAPSSSLGTRSNQRYLIRGPGSVHAYARRRD